MDAEAGTGGYRREEDEAGRLDRNTNELLQELRVAETGVQVLFAFLLTLVFQARFDTTTLVERRVYFGTLLLSAAAVCLLIAPVSIHRLLFRQHRKAQIVDLSNRLAIGGLACLAMAVTGSIFLITDVLFGLAAALLTALGVAAMFGWFWYAVPLRSRNRPDA